jgi:hypothetical protein
LVPVRKKPGLKAGAFSPALLVPVATTETNGLYKPGLKATSVRIHPLKTSYGVGSTKREERITYPLLVVPNADSTPVVTRQYPAFHIENQKVDLPIIKQKSRKKLPRLFWMHVNGEHLPVILTGYDLI